MTERVSSRVGNANPRGLDAETVAALGGEVLFVGGDAANWQQSTHPRSVPHS
ncbi:MAG TPA: hypothetical protein VK887_06855 [Pseudonocardiaceae bacterium]|nr:hypothetical protein [Pseudonocardiaceae bacterium]